RQGRPSGRRADARQLRAGARRQHAGRGDVEGGRPGGAGGAGRTLPLPPAERRTLRLLGQPGGYGGEPRLRRGGGSGTDGADGYGRGQGAGRVIPARGAAAAPRPAGPAEQSGGPSAVVEVVISVTRSVRAGVAGLV